ncbi:hypothetical protein [Streptomyces sp. NPDC006334]|uniref:hypothetical protein n=1 Tax=Streptomyces sp. NPDC006334 TaxID=3156754 RepID=UPI0033A11677
MGLRSRVTAALGGALLMAAGTVVLAPPASAEETCPYPYVCFYQRDPADYPAATISGRLGDVTSGWQWLTGSRGSDFVRNTRHDDVVYLHMTDGKVYCVENGGHKSFINDEPQRLVDGVRISSNPNC